MLTAVEVTTSQGALLVLPLEDVSDGLVLQNIDGLDPVKATLVSSSFATTDGAQYHSARREPRNIKLTLGLEPDYITLSVQDLRRRLYNFFMPKTQPNLRFRMDDGTAVDILGRVETFETALFSKEPAVDISLMCFDPDFQDPDSTVVSGMSTAGSNDTILDYEGSIETGLLFSLLVDRNVSAFTIYHRPPDGSLRIVEFSNPLVANDILKINTSVGSKSVIRKRAGIETSVLYAMSPQSNWLELQPGENSIRVYAEGAAIPYTIEYTTKYGGL